MKTKSVRLPLARGPQDDCCCAASAPRHCVSCHAGQTHFKEGGGYVHVVSGEGVLHLYSDQDDAHQKAIELGGTWSVLPVVADFRPDAAIGARRHGVVDDGRADRAVSALREATQPLPALDQQVRGAFELLWPLLAEVARGYSLVGWPDRSVLVICDEDSQGSPSPVSTVFDALTFMQRHEALTHGRPLSGPHSPDPGRRVPVTPDAISGRRRTPYPGTAASVA